MRGVRRTNHGSTGSQRLADGGRVELRGFGAFSTRERSPRKGRNPRTGVVTLDPAITTNVLAVMGSCGMYDYAGQWLYNVGMPAKSGVGGGVMAAV